MIFYRFGPMELNNCFQIKINDQIFFIKKQNVKLTLKIKPLSLYYFKIGKGNWGYKIVDGLEVNEFAKSKRKIAEDELLHKKKKKYSKYSKFQIIKIF